MTRVFLIAPSGRPRDRWEDLLEAAGTELVGSASDLESVADENLAAADIVLFDLSVEPSDDLLETLQAQDLLRESRVVLATAQHPLPWATQALRAGVRGILPRNVTPAQLAAALDAISHGFALVHSNELQLRPATNDTADFVEPLTAREREVLEMLSQGRGNKQIAARLKISDHTVKFHVASILGKLGATSRTEAVSIALRRGLILL